jgi:ammonium transporter, Amt family
LQFTNKYKYLLSIDEGLDIFAIHGVGGFVGDILTGFFAAKWVPALDGVSGDSYDGGWWDHNWIQMGYQLAAAVTCATWSFTITCILLFIINRIPGCHIRESEEDELKGLDFKYLHDVDEEMESRLFGAHVGGMGHITGRPVEHGAVMGPGTGVLAGEGGSESPSSMQEKDAATPTKRD